MAAANYAEDTTTAPPPLVKLAVERGKHLGDGLDMPAGMPPKLRTYRNAYDVMKSFKRAASRTAVVPWSKANPDAFELVSWVLARRRENNGN